MIKKILNINRRKSKLSTFSIFHWFCSSIAIILGIAPQSQRNRRISTKRCNRKANVVRMNKNSKIYTRQKCLQVKEINMHPDMNSTTNVGFSDICRSSKLSILNNNNNRNLDNLAYGDMNVNELLNVDQQRILCIFMKNDQLDEYIQSLLVEHASIFKDSRIIDLQELVKFIQSTTANITHEDASTMTNIDQDDCQITSCISFVTQSETARRLKALEFIRVFIEKSKEDFCKYLIHEEHLCQQKTLAIYQMIKQFLKTVYQSEHEQK